MGEIYSGCFADLGNKVIGIDEDAEVVKNLSRAIPPLKEPGLGEILARNIKKRRLKFSTDYKDISGCDAAWIAMDTPVDEGGKANVKRIFSDIKKSLPYIKDCAFLIVSSQLPAGTSAEIIKFVKTNRKNFKFSYAYIPENLRLGDGVASFTKASRVVIGIDDKSRKDELVRLFKKLKTNILIVSVASAEMIKHATNAFLATSLSFINDISDVCEKVGADVTEVSRGLKADARIGQLAYLEANTGFSGGHFERDLEFLRKVARSGKITLPVITSVARKNTERKKIVFAKISPLLGKFRGKKVTFLGLTYKSGTPVIKNSLSIGLAKTALRLGSKINLCDPFINPGEIVSEIPKGKFSYFADPYKSAKSSNVIICATPWPGLAKINFTKIAKLMARPKIFFDSRNYFAEERKDIEKTGIKYIGIGR